MFSVRVMVRARVTLRVEVMVTVGHGFRIRGRVKTRTDGLTMHTIVVQQPCSPQRSTAIHHTRATAMHSITLLAPY